MFEGEDSSTASNCSDLENGCYTTDDILEDLRALIFPTTVEWIFIFAHLVVFVVGLVGNVLVCTAVIRNNSMRTVTNYFIVNLAVADFMVILFCLPPTVVWDVTETWFFGDALCKIILYLQTVSVAVSVLTLTAISIERWYAICYPLKFKATTKRAKRVIVFIWVIALLLDTPELVVLHTVEGLHSQTLNLSTVYFTQCEASWSKEYEIVLVISRASVLYAIPLGFMTLAYYKIVCVLWSPARLPANEEALTTGSIHTRENGTDTSQVLMPIVRGQSVSQSHAIYSQLKSRRKAAKMLVAVVVFFAFCYLPVHMFSIIGLMMDLQQSDLLVAIAMTCHWLTYANSAANCVIYNFMSEKFRREFARAFKCFSKKRSLVPTTSRVCSCHQRNTHQDHNVQRV